MYPDLSIPGKIFPIRFEKVRLSDDDTRHVGVVKVNNTNYYSLVGIVPDKTQDDISFNVKGKALYINVAYFGDRYVYDCTAANYILLEIMGTWNSGSLLKLVKIVLDILTDIEKKVN